jgi:hypothetical protein
MAVIVVSVMVIALVIASIGIWVFRRKGLAKPSRQFQTRLETALPPKDMVVSIDGDDDDENGDQRYHQQSRVHFMTETAAPSRF